MIGGDIPLHKDLSPFYGQLSQSNGYYPQGGSSSNTLTLGMYYTRYSNGINPTQNIVASGSFNFPDLVQLYQYPVPNQNYNICLSSAGLGNIAPTPGVFDSRGSTVSMTLRGIVAVPLYSPFGGYPGAGTPSTGQEVIEVTIGSNYCPAYLNQDRIYGCIDVKVGSGSNSPALHYQAR